MAGRPTLDLLPGTRFGILTVRGKVRTPPRAHGGQRYRLECDCGNRITVPRFYLMRKSNPKSHCGCLDKKADNPYTKSSYYAMHNRCYYEGCAGYEHYGGRGIKVCERWHRDNPDGWKNFLQDMGPRPKGMSLDRYPNVDGDYAPDNCRWATPQQQTLNQRHRK